MLWAHAPYSSYGLNNVMGKWISIVHIGLRFIWCYPNSDKGAGGCIQ